MTISMWKLYEHVHHHHQSPIGIRGIMVSLSQTGRHQCSSFSKSGDHILFLMSLKPRKNGIGFTSHHLKKTGSISLVTLDLSEPIFQVEREDFKLQSLIDAKLNDFKARHFR